MPGKSDGAAERSVEKSAVEEDCLVNNRWVSGLAEEIHIGSRTRLRGFVNHKDAKQCP